MSNVASITEAPVKKRVKSSKPAKAANKKPASSTASEKDREQALNSVTQATEPVSNVAPLRAVPPPQPRERTSAVYSSGLTIKFTGGPNPVTAGTNRAAIWSLFENGMTVGEFMTALGTTDKRDKNGKQLKGGHGDLKIAVEKGYIELV
jgi:hypothetical protein|tara:strand:+ start:19481 stop:19927 length:447 start_codon:yes stop_codon:yes gene_type:complete